MNFYMIIILVVLAILGYNYIKRKGINVNEITVTDLNGRVVKTSKFDNVTNIEMNISDLSSGMYMMSIKSDAGTATKKIVKQ